MDQVKKDMEADKNLRKDWDKVQKSSDKMRQQSARHEEKLRHVGDGMKNVSQKTSETLREWKDRAGRTVEGTTRRVAEASEQSESMKKAMEYLRQASATGAAGSKATIEKTKGVFTTAMDKTHQAVAYFGDESSKADKHRQWKAAQDAAAAAHMAAEARKKAAEEAAAAEVAGGAREEAPPPPPEAGDALVVSKAANSSWDRFGAGLRDMPFLSSMFENPLFDRIFGESEIAASIREMKDMDRSFRLEDFAEDIEYVVAPHVVKTFLEGDGAALEKHCGEAAFAAVNASIKARKEQKMSLDPLILAGPKDVELKGAKLMDKGAPCFIWTFNTQQVNCLRDREGEIIEGAVDDIRTVYYAIAVTRHPEMEGLDLEYPWQISELAIVGNQPCW